MDVTEVMNIVNWIGNHARWTTIVFGASLAVMIASIWMGHYFLTTIPADYFAKTHKPLERWRNSHPALRAALLLVKNFVGTLLIMAGVVMIVTPGQGMLTLLLGLMLVDFPGKRALERRLIERPLLLKVVNRIRTKAGQAPLTFS